MREAVSVMRRQKAGAIVNIAPALHHPLTREAYACHATTGAVRSMTRNAALACMTDNIRVNVVLSGFAQAPMLRGVAPIQVAYGCLFLCSDEAGGISGAELAIDGSGPVAAPIS
jgi:3alpha(or 20beta)-hydroxysteroid dehydrogenase